MVGCEEVDARPSRCPSARATARAASGSAENTRPPSPNSVLFASATASSTVLVVASGCRGPGRRSPRGRSACPGSRRRTRWARRTSRPRGHRPTPLAPGGGAGALGRGPTPRTPARSYCARWRIGPNTVSASSGSPCCAGGDRGGDHLHHLVVAARGREDPGRDVAGLAGVAHDDRISTLDIASRSASGQHDAPTTCRPVPASPAAAARRRPRRFGGPPASIR